MENKVFILIGVALLLIWTSQQPQTAFLIFGGVEIEGGVTNITGDCYTLAESDRCVRQNVNLVNFTRQNLLVCPEGYYSTKLECEKAYKIIVEPKPKVTCYYIGEDECQMEVIEGMETCPSQYYSAIEECEEELRTPLRHIGALIKNPIVLIAIIIGLVAGLILLLKK